MTHFKSINKSDNKNTRNAKKSFRNKLNRQSKKSDVKTNLNLLSENQQAESRTVTYYSSSILYTAYIEEFCEKNNIHKWRTSPTNFKMDSDFSLFENPDRVLTSLLQMLRSAKTRNQKARISYKGFSSFGALYLIDNMCWEIGKNKRWLLQGDLPEEDKAIFSSIKSIISNSYENDNAYLINAKVQINQNSDATSKQSYKVRCKEITDMLQNALRERHGSDYQLSQEAYHAINSTIGEQFDNIVLHVPGAQYGTLCGFYNKSTKEITILIFNFGPTIYQTLNYEKLPTEMLNDIEKVIENHNTRKFFIGKKEFTKENAITLLALQEGISSKISDDQSRGQGFIDYIINCFELNLGTKIAIISGNTAISIDKRYQAETKNVLGRDRRILALNDDNDIFQKPDSKYVKNMNVFFPGVIIETTIPLS